MLAVYSNPLVGDSLFQSDGAINRSRSFGLMYQKQGADLSVIGNANASNSVGLSRKH